MGTFLFLLFIFFIVIPFVRLVYRVYRVRKTFNDTMHRMYNQQQEGAARDAHQRKAGWDKPVAKRKKIGDDIGEYVKFEEITVIETNETVEKDTTDRGAYSTESQITDADWEDIN